jgi:hypothetical protein
MKFKRRNVMDLADLICGNVGVESPKAGETPANFPYRSSSYISMFFEDIDTDYRHDGTTRNWWIADVLEKMLNEPHDGPSTLRKSSAESSTTSWIPPTPSTKDPTVPTRSSCSTTS